jgi:hypothetical protein
MALTYSDITSTTLKYMEKKLIDNIFAAYPVVEKLIYKGKIKEFTAGEKIFIPIEMAENANVGWIGKSGTIPTEDTQTITAVEDSWRILAGTVKFNDLDIVLNRGPEQIVDLMKSKITNLEKTMKHNLGTSLHTAQTGDAMNGLPDIVSTSTTLHGVAVADFAGWIAGYANNTSEPLSIIDMGTAYNTVADGADHPDLLISSQTLYEKYESLVAPQLRFKDNRTADAGFTENLTFKGGVLVLDKLCTSDRIYFLTTDYLYLACIKDRKFHAFPAVQAANQLYDVVKVVFYGNLMTSNRRMQGMLDGRTA